MQLSPNFTLDEAILSQTASRLGINNYPSPEVILHMQAAAAQLEKVRLLLGHPITVSSWYRSPALNAQIGGVKGSAHVDGYAIDFNCREYGTLLDVVTTVANCSVPFDQVIFEYDAWCHISFAPALRGQVLTVRQGTGYMTGLILP